MRRLGFLTLGLVCACVPDLHAVLGKACDDPHPCPDALFCVDGACSETTPADVAVLDVDFEGGIGSFEATSGARLLANTATPHAGTTALKILTGETATLPFGALSLPDAMTVGTGRYCASAWVLHGQGDGALSLTLRTYGGVNGTSLQAESTAGVATVSGARAWQRVTTELPVDATEVSSVRLVVTSQSPITADFSIDDVHVVRAWRSCDGL